MRLNTKNTNTILVVFSDSSVDEDEKRVHSDTVGLYFLLCGYVSFSCCIIYLHNMLLLFYVFIYL